MAIKKKIISLLHEHREDVYRVFFVWGFKFKFFSHKYAIRQLQAEIRELHEEQKNTRLDIQKVNQNIADALKSIANNELQCTVTEKYDEIINCLNEVNIRQEMFDAYIEQNEIVVNLLREQGKLLEELKQQENTIKLLGRQDEVIDNIQQVSKDIVKLFQDSQNDVEKINKSVVSNRNLLQKMEFENLALHKNAIVHLSAYMKKGNAGDTLLVPTLRDSIGKTVETTLNWCHKSVRNVLDDETVQAINCSKGVVVGGGGLFLRDTNANEISGWQWPCSLNELDKIKVPVYMLGVGYNRFRGQDDFEPYFKENINEIVRKFEFIGLRNNGSVRAIQQYLDDDLKRKVQFHPCATTVLSKMYRMPHVNVDKPFIAVNCAFDRSNLRYGERKHEILSSITNALKIYSGTYKIKYYAHMQPDKEILPYFDEVGLEYEVVELDKGLSTDDFLKVYSEPTLVLAMRGHAQLIPFGCGTPALSIISHDKLQWFLEDINHPEWGVDVREEKFEKMLVEKMQEMLANQELIKEEIEKAKDILWDVTQNNIRNHFKIN